MRTKLMNNFIKRRKALYQKLTLYNKLAAEFGYRTLDKDELWDAAVSGNMDRLRADIETRPWCLPAAVDAMNRLCNYRAAMVEESRIVVEIGRLERWIDDQKGHFEELITSMEEQVEKSVTEEQSSDADDQNNVGLLLSPDVHDQLY